MTEGSETVGLGGTQEPSTAQAARIYDAFNGGKDYSAADEQAAQQAELEYPHIGYAARRNRAFVLRAATYLARQDLFQFLDIGTGIPSPPNLHDVVWQVKPEAKILYVDNDDAVLRHAQPFVKAAGGRADFLPANIVDTPAILDRASRFLDLGKPVALSAMAVWHFLKDGYTLNGRVYQPVEVMRELVAALAPGSFVAISHVTCDFEPDAAERLASVYRKRGIPAQARSRSGIEELFAGLPLVAPGLVEVDLWHPDLDTDPSTREEGREGIRIPVYAGIARKP